MGRGVGCECVGWGVCVGECVCGVGRGVWGVSAGVDVGVGGRMEEVINKELTK